VEEKLHSVLLDKDSHEKTWSRFLSGFTPDQTITIQEEYKSQEAKVLEQVEEFVNDSSVTSYRMPFIHGGQRWMKGILSAIHEKFSSLRLMEEVSGGGTRRYLTKKSPQEIFNDYLGFRRVWKILIASAKPVIVHNGFLDLMFCYQAFENKLPDTVSDFKSELKTMFPGGVFDTRLIAIESGFASSGAALETLVEMLKDTEPFKSVSVVDSGNYAQNVQYHDAGYDALLTGKVFKALAIDTDVLKWKNMICMARCLWVLTIDNLETDKVLIDCGIGKSRIIRYITDISGSTRDVLNSFDDLKSVVNGLVVNIQWIDDSSGLLLLSFIHPADKTVDSVVSSLNSKMLEIVKSNGNGQLGTSAKLWTIPDFIKKQLDSLEPSKKFRL
jgi:hypothetical protein